MKKNMMAVPPLSQLYLKKKQFQVHKKKLEKIMIERKINLEQSKSNKNQQSIKKRHGFNFSHRYNVNSLKLAEENNRIIKKIETIKPAYDFKSSCSSRKETNRIFTQNSRAKFIERDRENSRMKNKVKSMNSSLNNQKLMEDYRKSMQIKKRITHFKTQSNDRVVLKAAKYLGGGSEQKKKFSQNKSQQIFKMIAQKTGSQVFPKIRKPKSGLQNKFIKDQSQKPNAVAFYKKQDILKNKIITNNKLFKLARQKRLITLDILQHSKPNKQSGLKESNGNSPDNASNMFFATQLSSKMKFKKQ